MAIVRSIKCDRCGLVLLKCGTGTVVYMRKPAGFIRRLLGLRGKKEYLSEPPIAKRQKSLDMDQAIQEGRFGYRTVCFCLDCLKKFSLDSESVKRCKKCKSTNIKSASQIIGMLCPKCRQGMIVDKKIGIT